MPQTPAVYVISDSLGDTAAAVAEAVVSQFPSERGIRIERLVKVRSLDEIASYLEPRQDSLSTMVVLHTLADKKLRQSFIRYADTHGIYAVDIIGSAISALSVALDESPIEKPGAVHETDASYFRRIEAMEYTVNHDDGRNDDDLTGAEIVLIGVSRTSKTPLSLILATKGYKVANVPLAPGMKPPDSLFKVDTRRIFGLMSTAEVLSEIRFKRLGSAQAVASDYATPEKVQEDLDEARAFMRKLGCIVLRTDHKAVEETAQEILRYYHASLAT